MIGISFYGIVYTLAFLISFFIIREYLKVKNKNPELAFSAIIYFIIGILIGARVFYVLFYSPIHFFENSLEIFYIWNGGLSFHGALLGAIISGYLFCRKNEISFLELGDVIVIPAAFFLSLGRIANFINSELYGKITNLPWCVNFKNIDGCRHPVQIYSSIKNLFIFIFLIYLKKTRRLNPGVIMFSFMFLYSLLRFFIDFFRVYNFVFFGLGTGQYLDMIIVLISGYFLFKISIKKN